jgi:2-methylcitrate dehydratase
MDAIAGRFDIDWSREDVERVTHTIVKKYNAEVHSQTTLEGILELKQKFHFIGEDVERIDIKTFDVAYNIIGGGEEGDKTIVRTKEQADHSLQYMVAVAILDSRVMPAQYGPDRITQQDTQALLRRVFVRPGVEFSERFPGEMPCSIKVSLRDGRTLVKEKKDYEGFYTRPMQWETVVQKFERLTEARINKSLQRQIADSVENLEKIQVSDLMRLLAKVQ